MTIASNTGNSVTGFLLPRLKPFNALCLNCSYIVYLMVGFTVSNNEAPTPAYKFGTVVVKISTSSSIFSSHVPFIHSRFLLHGFLGWHFHRNFRMAFEEMQHGRRWTFLFITSRNELEEATLASLLPVFVADLCPGVLMTLSSSSDSQSESLSLSESEISRSFRVKLLPSFFFRISLIETLTIAELSRLVY